MKDWQAILLAVFAVAAGQVLKIGRKLEAGEPVKLRDLLVLLSTLPAFGSLIGLAGAHYGLPTWQILLCGIVAGWLGVGFMKIVLAAFRAILGQFMQATKVE